MMKAIIPIKVYGSEGLKNKNTMILAGREMWEWIVLAALGCPEIDKVYMTGNVYEKKLFFERNAKLKYPGLEWIDRPIELQENGREILETMKHCLKKVGKKDKDDVFIQLQPTKPMTTAKDLSEIIKFFDKREPALQYSGASGSFDMTVTALFERQYDSLFTVQEIHTAVDGEYKSDRHQTRHFKSCAMCKIWSYEALKSAIIGTWGQGERHHDYVIPSRHIEVDTYEDFLMVEALKRGGL